MVIVPGAGSVTGTGINCPGECSQPFPVGTSITLTAVPDPGLGVTDWQGTSCSGDTCQLNLASDSLSRFL